MRKVGLLALGQEDTKLPKTLEILQIHKGVSRRDKGRAMCAVLRWHSEHPGLENVCEMRE